MLYHHIILNGRPASASIFAPPPDCEVLYEVIRVTGGIFLFLEDHIERLEHSAELAGIRLPASAGEIREQLKQLLQINRISDGNVRLEYYFLAGEVKYQAAYFIQHRYPAGETYLNGICVSLFRAERSNPNAKIMQPELIARISQVAAEKGVYEVIMVHPDGYITEGSRSNFFMVKDKTVYTAPGADVLPGITRKYVLQACRELLIPLEEKRISADRLPAMDAVFISGTSPKVLPVSQIDEMRFDPGNDTVRRIMKRYDELAGL